MTASHRSPTVRLLVRGIAIAALLAVPLALIKLAPAAAESAQVVPAPRVDEPLAQSSGTASVVLAGGCFWGVQAVFQHTEGVISAVSGYSGGSADTAVYELVGRGSTGHAEAVKVDYDPSEITYGEILQIFFSVVHDPTQVNRQGPDVGPQYRSAIFTANASQADIASGYIAQLDGAGVYGDPIATEVAPLQAFYPAEDYHQDYATLHPDSAYIAYHDIPKIRNLERLFPEVYRAEPVLVFANAGG